MKAKYITSVCTGSLVLGAAGLIKGKRATSHWNHLDFLGRFGASPVHDRVVFDGNLITAAGVSAGIDLAFHLLAELIGREEAEMTQLYLEYAPEPPFASGSLNQASQEVIEKVCKRTANARVLKERVLATLEERQLVPTDHASA